MQILLVGDRMSVAAPNFTPGYLIQPKPDKWTRLGGNLYKIHYTKEDIERRNNFFTGNGGELTSEEEKLLRGIGITDIDAQLGSDYKKIMPDFYNALPNCQTSAAIALSSKCYLPRDIITQILNRAATNSLISQSQPGKTPTLDQQSAAIGMISQIVNQITGPSSLESGAALSPKMANQSDMVDFFVLRV